MSEQLSKGTWLTWKQSNLPAIMNSHSLPLNVRTNVDLSLARQRESRDISWETLPAASGGNFLWWEILQVRQCWRCAPALRPAASSWDKSAVSWRKKINLTSSRSHCRVKLQPLETNGTILFSINDSRQRAGKKNHVWEATEVKI